MKEVGKHPDLDEETIAKLIALEAAQHEHHSRAWYRVNATRGLTGGSKVQPALDGHVMEVAFLNSENVSNPFWNGCKDLITMSFPMYILYKRCENDLFIIISLSFLM